MATYKVPISSSSSNTKMAPNSSIADVELTPPQQHKPKMSSKVKGLFKRNRSKKHTTTNNNNNNATSLSPHTLAALQNDESLPHPTYNTSHLAPSKLSLNEISKLLYNNLEIRERKYHLKTYSNCFVASELIDYLIGKCFPCVRLFVCAYHVSNLCNPIFYTLMVPILLY